MATKKDDGMAHLRVYIHRKQCPNCLRIHEARTELCYNCERKAMALEVGIALTVLTAGGFFVGFLLAVLS